MGKTLAGVKQLQVYRARRDRITIIIYLLGALRNLSSREAGRTLFVFPIFLFILEGSRRDYAVGGF
jgi:hypothetical protein